MKNVIVFLTSLILFTSFLISINSEAQTVLLDSSGRDGSDARDGRDGSREQDGTDAGRSTPGEDAGDVRVKLTDLNSGESTRMNFHVFGTVDGQRYDKTVTYSNGIIRVDATGGDGGDGGHGGDGGAGRDGADGRDATRSSSGGDGKDGGNGGDGGNGSPGSDAGDGGSVIVELDEVDTHLAMLVQYDVSAGDGGDRGSNGDGGRRGYGGDGGRSHSWTEREEDGTDRVCNPDTEKVVSNGDGSFSTRTVRGSCRNVTKYKTVRYSNPGGSDGRDGSSGSGGNGRTSAGQDGQNGNFEFHVRQSNGQVARYRSLFRMTLESYQLTDENRDGIFEPGEMVTVSNIVVKNRGEMPSPNGKAKILVTLRNGNWFLANPIQLEVPRLTQGQSVRLEDTLQFKIKDTNLVSNNERFQVSESITPVAHITRVNKVFGEFQLPKTIRVTYPIEMSPMVARSTVGAGEMIDVHWKLTNLSTKDFGADSELGRSIFTSLIESRPGQQAKVEFIHPSHTGGLNQRFTSEVARLRAGESVIIAGKLRFSEDLPVYSTVALTAGLGLQHHSNDAVRNIQENTFEFTISQIYRHNPESHFLLILNENTTREEYLTWKQLASSLGVKMDIWDISYYGFLSLTRDLDDSQGSLMRNYKDKTIIMINSPAPSGQRSFQMVSQRDFLNAARSSNLNLLVLGGGTSYAKNVVRSVLMNDIPSMDYQNIKSVERTSDFSEGEGFIVRGKPKFWQSAQAIMAEKEQEIRERLLEVDPDGDYYVTSALRQRADGKTYVLGEFVITPSLSLGQGHIVALDVTDREIKSPSYILGQKNLMALLLVSPLEAKMQILSNAQLSEIKVANTEIHIKNVLMHDLAILANVEDRTSDEFESSGELYQALDYVSRTLRNADSDLKSAATEALVSVKFYLEQSGAGGLFGYGSNSYRLKAANHISSLLEELGVSKNTITSLTDELQKTFDRRQDTLVGLSKQDNLLRMMTLPAVHMAHSSEQKIQGVDFRGDH